MPEPKRYNVNPDLASSQLLKLTDGVLHCALQSRAMKGTMGVTIALPRGYAESPNSRWPVVYFLHGYTGSEATDFKDIALYLVKASRGEFPRAIYVFPNGMNEYYLDRADGSRSVETHIVDELLPWVDATFRTDSLRRGLVGFSMGGYGAIRLHLLYPELFKYAVSIDGALIAKEDPSSLQFTLEFFGSEKRRAENSMQTLVEGFLSDPKRNGQKASVLVLEGVGPSERRPTVGETIVSTLSQKGHKALYLKGDIPHLASLFYHAFQEEVLAFESPFLADAK